MTGMRQIHEKKSYYLSNKTPDKLQTQCFIIDLQLVFM